MSRVSRSQELLKTGFLNEAASAAKFRAYARQAAAQGLERLAARWSEMAAAKDELAIEQLQAVGQILDSRKGVAEAIAEEAYENDVLYPRMIRSAEPEAGEVLKRIVAAQQEHVAALGRLQDELQAAAGGDIG